MTTLLISYQDIFAWSYDDMVGLDKSIVAHKLPLKPKSVPVKQKLRKLRPAVSLEVKEEIVKQFNA